MGAQRCDPRRPGAPSEAITTDFRTWAQRHCRGAGGAAGGPDTGGGLLVSFQLWAGPPPWSNLLPTTTARFSRAGRGSAPPPLPLLGADRRRGGIPAISGAASSGAKPMSCQNAWSWRRNSARGTHRASPGFAALGAGARAQREGGTQPIRRIKTLIKKMTMEGLAKKTRGTG